MDAQELRNLQEAYLEVVMNEETDKTGNHLDTYASKKYFGDKLDFYVDAGPLISTPSTLVDLTGSLAAVIRQGEAPFQIL